MERYRIRADMAPDVAEWLREGRGIAVWESINLSNPGAAWLTPARDRQGVSMSKPNWQAANAPARVLERAEEFEVVTAEEVKRFHVAVRRGSQGLMLKVTDGGSRRIRREVAKAGEGAWYEFDYADYENAVIYTPGEVVPLEELLKEAAELLKEAAEGMMG